MRYYSWNLFYYNLKLDITAHTEMFNYKVEINKTSDSNALLPYELATVGSKKEGWYSGAGGGPVEFWIGYL
jgi:hypothetical protein